MVQSKPEHGISDARRSALGVIFPAMDTKDYEFLTISFFELPQLRKYVDAVDSAVGPEIEQHDSSTQITEMDRAVGRIDPVEIVGKLGSSHRRQFHGIVCHVGGRIGKRVA